MFVQREHFEKIGKYVCLFVESHIIYLQEQKKDNNRNKVKLGMIGNYYYTVWVLKTTFQFRFTNTSRIIYNNQFLLLPFLIPCYLKPTLTDFWFKGSLIWFTNVVGNDRLLISVSVTQGFPFNFQFRIHRAAKED